MSVFSSVRAGCVRVILATNIAESSITLPTVRCMFTLRGVPMFWSLCSFFFVLCVISYAVFRFLALCVCVCVRVCVCVCVCISRSLWMCMLCPFCAVVCPFYALCV